MKEFRLMTFQEFLDYYYWKGFDASGLSDEEYYELEDLWNEYREKELKEMCKRIWDSISNLEE